MALTRALLIADVAHARQRPKPHRFHYGVYYLCVALSDLPLLARLKLIARNGFNLFGFHDADYGDKPEQWLRSKLAEWGVTAADGEVVLMTLPRVLGYAFNPVSFWFCLDRGGALRAVLAQVSNTFGERHGYLLFHDDQRPIQRDDWLACEKIFHVSPFIEVGGHYEFRFAYAEERIGVWINHHDAEGLLLTTSVTGKRQELTSASLLYYFLRYPLVTMKVIGLIHLHALGLFLKGIRYRVKPAPPTSEISR